MSEHTTEEPEPIVIKNADDVDRVLGELDTLATYITDAATSRDAVIATASEAYEEVTATWVARQQEILQALKEYLMPRRRSWLRRFGRTAKLENGAVMWKMIGASLVTPKDETPVVAALLGMRGGKKLLRVKWEVERKAFSTAPAWILRRLKPLGVYYTRHETLSVKAGNHKAIELDKRPYPRIK